VRDSYDVCIAEDCPNTRRLIFDTLSRAGFICRALPDGLAAWEEITRNPPKVILSDWHMPGLDGLELCNRVRGHSDIGDTFFVLMTAHDQQGSKTLALCSGADDYLTKPIDLDELVARMRVGQRMWMMQEKLRQAANTDGLTGLYNHDHLNRILEAEMNRSRRYGGALSFIMIDLDFFKAVNDTYGHLVGNAVLVQVADCLRRTVREVDSISRFGGDEFAVVAPEATLEAASVLAERILTALDGWVKVEGATDFKLGASMGVCSTDDVRVKNAADLVNLADHAMYVAKRKGRNRVCTSPEVADEQAGADPVIEFEEVNSLRKRLAVLSVQAKQVYIQSIASLVQALDEKDPYTARHSQNVSLFAERLAHGMGCSEGAILAAKNAGLLHDIGKVGIPDRILLKPASLTPLELAVMKQVPLISARIVDHLRILESERQIIRYQREHFDGTGVPEGLKGDAIPIGARILHVADAFDAMTTDRVYRRRRSLPIAVGELKRLAGSQFDPAVIETLCRLLDTEREWWGAHVDATNNAFPMLTASDA
jgi:diguanylate cyclase (GGDEF)-like protein